VHEWGRDAPAAPRHGGAHEGAGAGPTSVGPSAVPGAQAGAGVSEPW